MTENSDLEKYAPRKWRPSEKLNDVDIERQRNMERDIIHQSNVSILHRQRSEFDSANDPAAENLNAQIMRVAGASMDEIDRVITELESVREMLRSEGERVAQNVADYASLNQAALTVMKLIADSIKHWKNAPDNADRNLAS